MSGITASTRHDTCGITAAGAPGTAICDGSQGKVGWGVDAGIKYNLPSFGAGDDVILTGSYTQNAVWYSGLPDAQNGELGQVNGNGQPMYLADAYFNPLTNSWATPRAWSVSGLLEHHWTPTFYTDLEGSVGGILWNGQSGGICTAAAGGCVGTGQISPHAFTWLVGADIGWNPVTNLNFDLELMYQHVQQTHPAGTLEPSSTPALSFRARFKARARASRVVSASPVTSDRIPIS